MSKKQTLKEAKRLIKKWQKLLNLQDWRIRVEIAKGELPDGDKHEYACVYHSFEQHNAIIHVRTLDQWDGVDEGHGNMDLETLIIHELIHLHMAKFMPRKNLWKVEYAELCINQLTDAFLTLSRENDKLIENVKDNRKD